MYLKGIAVFLLSMAIVGCAQMYAALPYLPTAKVAYCATANEETRDKIRAKYDLPKVVHCSGDEG